MFRSQCCFAFLSCLLFVGCDPGQLPEFPGAAPSGEETPLPPDEEGPSDDEAPPKKKGGGQDCETELLGTLSLSSSIGEQTVGEMLALWDGKREGIWTHEPETSSKNYFVLDPDDEQRPGSYMLEYLGGKIEHYRSTRVSGSSDTKEFVQCLDFITVPVRVELSTDDGTLSESFETSLMISDPRDPSFRPRKNALAKLSSDMGTGQFQGTQTLRVVHDETKTLTRQRVHHFAKYYKSKAPMIEIGGQLNTEDASGSGVKLQTLFYFEQAK